MGFVEALERLVRQPRNLSRVAARVMVIGRGWEQFLIQRFPEHGPGRAHIPLHFVQDHPFIDQRRVWVIRL